jgi:hypothetical protein
MNHERHHESLAELEASVDRRWVKARDFARTRRVRATNQYANKAVRSHRVSLNGAWRAHLYTHGVKRLGPFLTMQELKDMHTERHENE